MSRHDPKVTLRQIADYARRAQELCTQNELPAILTDWHKWLAFERVMEVLGESVKRLPPDLCQRYPAVPWKLVTGLRDRVSHGYDGIDTRPCGIRCVTTCRGCLPRSGRC